MAEHLGEHVLGHHPVLQQVGDPRGHPQVVLQDVHRAVGVADEVAPADVGPDATGGVHADALAPEIGRPGHQLGGDDTGAHRSLVVVDVVDEQVERVEPLDQARFDKLPLLGGHHPGNDIEGPRAVHPGRPFVDGEGHPDGPHLAVGCVLTFAEGFGAQLGEVPPQALGRRPWGAVGSDHLVEELARIVGGPGGGRRRGTVLGRVRWMGFVHNPCDTTMMGPMGCHSVSAL